MTDWLQRYMATKGHKFNDLATWLAETFPTEAQKGGPGSGHWGHAGRPGKRGGSVPGSVAVSIRTGRTARERQEAARAAGGQGKTTAQGMEKNVPKQYRESFREGASFAKEQYGDFRVPQRDLLTTVRRGHEMLAENAQNRLSTLADGVDKSIQESNYWKEKGTIAGIDDVLRDIDERAPRYQKIADAIGKARLAVSEMTPKSKWDDLSTYGRHIQPVSDALDEAYKLVHKNTADLPLNEWSSLVDSYNRALRFFEKRKGGDSPFHA